MYVNVWTNRSERKTISDILPFKSNCSYFSSGLEPEMEVNSTYSNLAGYLNTTVNNGTQRIPLLHNAHYTDTPLNITGDHDDDVTTWNTTSMIQNSTTWYHKLAEFSRNISYHASSPSFNVPSSPPPQFVQYIHRMGGGGGGGGDGHGGEGSVAVDGSGSGRYAVHHGTVTALCIVAVMLAVISLWIYCKRQPHHHHHPHYGYSIGTGEKYEELTSGVDTGDQGMMGCGRGGGVVGGGGYHSDYVYKPLAGAGLDEEYENTFVGVSIPLLQENTKL